MQLLAAISSGSGFSFIVAAGAATYIASKAAVDATIGRGKATAGRVAVAQWLPIAIVSIAAMLTHRPQVAVGIVFSTVVACMSLAAGAALYMAPLAGPATSRRSWTLLTPAALLVFLTGFHGEISVIDAVILLTEGFFVLLLWTDRSIDAPDSTVVERKVARGSGGLRMSQLALAVVLAGVGAWFAMRGVDVASATTDLGSSGLLTATLLSPMLVLPIIGTGTELAQRNQSSTAVSANVGLSFLNIFVLLPLLVMISARQEIAWQLRHGWEVIRVSVNPNAMPVVAPHFQSSLVFPLAVWRVDVVLVIALGLFLLPVAAGRWSLNKFHGLAMMFVYAIYLVLSFALVRRL